MQDIAHAKTCRKCGETKPASAFYANRVPCRTCIYRENRTRDVRRRAEFDPTERIVLNGADFDRFRALYTIADGGCWPWRAPRRDGYGRFWYLGLDRPAHRVAYEHFVGKIAAGLDIDHLCRNRACVNPAHLEPVTRRENVARGLFPIASRVRAVTVTHCKHGHPFDDANTWVDREGERHCRACHRNREYARYLRRTHKV